MRAGGYGGSTSLLLGEQLRRRRLARLIVASRATLAAVAEANGYANRPRVGGRNSDGRRQPDFRNSALIFAQVIDFWWGQVERSALLPLNHPAVAPAATLHHAPVAVLLAVLEASSAAHEHGRTACPSTDQIAPCCGSRARAAVTSARSQ